MTLRTLLLAGLGAAALSFSASAATQSDPASTSVAKPALTQLAANPNQCWTDEGYGRKGPCGSFAKKKKKKKKS